MGNCNIKSSDDQENTILLHSMAQYNKIQIIGKGGFGKVWKV